MKIDVGPVAPASALAWIAWADEVFGEQRNDPSSALSCAYLLHGAGGYLEQWKRPDHRVGGTFRWRADVDPDELECLMHAFRCLDERLTVETRDGGQFPALREGRDFYVVLVRDVLHALEMEGPARAAFVDHLRGCWPSAADAS